MSDINLDGLDRALYLMAVLSALAGFVLSVVPARVLQKRHGYSAWVLVFGLVPYLAPVFLLWALAFATPRVTLGVSV